MKYEYVVDYRDNQLLRNSFNELAVKTFGINFNDWYQKGLWENQYIPYSLADGHKIVANASVNIMNFQQDGIFKNYIQIGTVMTDEAYRRKGLSRYLLEHILTEYKEKVDGIYLFANNTVLEFYPKFGFKAVQEYEYSKTIPEIDSVYKVEKVDMSDKSNWDKLLDASSYAHVNMRLSMNNKGLLGFWTTSFKKESIYYIPEKEAYIIADIEEETLIIEELFAKQRLDLDKIAKSFGDKIKTVKLHFTPYIIEGYTLTPYQEDDCTLFIMGEQLESIEKEKLKFSTLSHA